MQQHGPSQILRSHEIYKDSWLEGTENIRCVSIGFDEALAMVMDGRMTHGPSCVLILKAARFLEHSR